MAVKTITIDMEAYERLAAIKRTGESFSQVIKALTANSSRTAKALLADAESMRLRDETLDAIEAIVREREADFPRTASLDAVP
jgi:predicted CopG family antitoxin